MDKVVQIQEPTFEEDANQFLMTKTEEQDHHNILIEENNNELSSQPNSSRLNINVNGANNINGIGYTPYKLIQQSGQLRSPSVL